MAKMTIKEMQGMYRSRMKTYDKKRDQLVRQVLRDLAAEGGWEVVNVIREGGNEKVIWRIK